MSMIVAAAGSAIGGGGVSRRTEGLATGGLFALGSAMKAFMVIPEGQMGVRTHFNRATRVKGERAGELYGVVGPGLQLIFPFTHGIKLVSTQKRASNLGEIIVKSQQDEQLAVNSAISWAVRRDDDNPYKALFVPESHEMLEADVMNLCASGIFRVMNGINKQSMYDVDTIDHDVKDICVDGLLEYGVELRQVRIKSVSETPAEILTRAQHLRSGTIAAVSTVLPELISLDQHRA